MDLPETIQGFAARPTPLGVRAYRAATAAGGAFARMTLRNRLAAGKEDPARVSERTGAPGRPRPDGGLIWLHGASVGESLSVLPLVSRLLSVRSDVSFLVTTGTVTSARLMAERLPARAMHQFVPIDHPTYVARFLNHWRPDAALFVESEFWPNLILGARSQVALMGLVNGRVSPRSFASWSKRPRTIAYLLAAFDFLIGQDRQNAERLSALSGRPVQSYGNLKNAAPPLPVNEADLSSVLAQVGARPVWLAARTHPGEEPVVFAVHKHLMAAYPDVLTVLTPRHPERGAEIDALAAAAGLTSVRRSSGAALTRAHQIYIADTLGELGLFYRMSNVAFIGGSIVEKGGHNPLEPARLGCAILHGPNVFNFAETYADLRGGSGAALVRNDRELATAVSRLLADDKTRFAMADAARAAAASSAERALSDIVGQILGRLDPEFLAA